MVHGRNSYIRTATLDQFVMHRGMIISTMQVTYTEYEEPLIIQKVFTPGLMHGFSFWSISGLLNLL